MWPLIAQPLASSIGLRLRSRSFNQAINMLGPEMANMMPISAIGIHQPRSTNLPNTPTNTALMLPSATPNAATVPTSILLGPLFAGAGAVLDAAAPDAVLDAPVPAATRPPATEPRLLCVLTSLAAAR